MSTTTSYKAGTAESTVEFSGLENSFDKSAAIKRFVDTNRRNLMLATGLVLVLVFILWASSFNGSKQPMTDEQQVNGCPLTSKRPNYEQNLLENSTPQFVSSIDRKSTASFRGYLEFFYRDAFNIKERESYQKLSLRSIDWLQIYEISDAAPTCERDYHSSGCDLKQHTMNITTRRLKLKADCAIIELSISKIDDKWELKWAQVVYDAGSAKDGERMLGFCMIGPAAQLNFKSHHHYRCQRKQTLNCSLPKGYQSRDPMFVQLWIEELEYELNGNADVIKDGIFSKPGDDCSLPMASTES